MALDPSACGIFASLVQIAVAGMRREVRCRRAARVSPAKARDLGLDAPAGAVWIPAGGRAKLWLAALLLGLPGAVAAQFSPGKLSSAHASLDGPTDCLHCHEPRQAATAERCQTCHRELAARVEAGRGFHGRMESDRRGRCGACHAEHGGRESGIVTWPGGRDAFDHKLAGFVLEGRHESLHCPDCHKPDLVRAADVRAGRSVKLEKTYLGLSKRCSDCHRDEHHGQFALEIEPGDCARCHSTAGWKSVSLDHSRTRFPLAGQHARVACARCHYSVNASGARVQAGKPRSFRRFRPLEFGACTACHTDAHRDRYGQDCSRCHSTAGWNVIATGAFEHDRTPYALRGRHRQVDCLKCHRSGDFKRSLDSKHCSTCHAEAHGGQLAQRADHGACESCHTVQGFAPASFGPAEHEQTRFPLRDAHRAVACSACHLHSADGAPRGSVVLRYKSRACAVCHADAHAGQFAARHGETDCTRCHSTSSWQIQAFDHQRQTRFALDGAHARAACAACHRQETIGLRRVARYKPVDSACRACHAEPPPGSKRKG